VVVQFGVFVAAVERPAEEVVARVQTGASPTSIAVTPGGRKAYVTNFDDGTVRVLRTGQS
jgi:DNA-binding beta-propeller fold protein YncE